MQGYRARTHRAVFLSLWSSQRTCGSGQCWAHGNRVPPYPHRPADLTRHVAEATSTVSTLGITLVLRSIEGPDDKVWPEGGLGQDP
jgi:hypothetical protein